MKQLKKQVERLEAESRRRGSKDFGHLIYFVPSPEYERDRARWDEENPGKAWPFLTVFCSSSNE